VAGVEVSRGRGCGQGGRRVDRSGGRREAAGGGLRSERRRRRGGAEVVGRGAAAAGTGVRSCDLGLGGWGRAGTG
jgi:hypothetical protein